jgi:hypothetical protein
MAQGSGRPMYKKATMRPQINSPCAKAPRRSGSIRPDRISSLVPRYSMLCWLRGLVAARVAARVRTGFHRLHGLARAWKRAPDEVGSRRGKRLSPRGARSRRRRRTRKPHTNAQASQKSAQASQKGATRGGYNGSHRRSHARAGPFPTALAAVGRRLRDFGLAGRARPQRVARRLTPR